MDIQNFCKGRKILDRIEELRIEIASTKSILNFLKSSTAKIVIIKNEDENSWCVVKNEKIEVPVENCVVEGYFRSEISLKEIEIEKLKEDFKNI